MNATGFYSTVAGRRFEFNVLLPEDYAVTDTRYPVVYLLHGRGETKDSWLDIDALLRQLGRQGDIPPLIAIFPDAPSSNRAGFYVDSRYTGERYPSERVETAFVRDLIPYVDRAYRTDTSRDGRLIGGYSMGGYGALRFVLAYPTLFSRALLLSPAVYVPLPPPVSNIRLFGAFGREDVLFDDAVYEELNYPGLFARFAHGDYPARVFVAVGDRETKHPSDAHRLNDLDMEAHRVFNTLVRAPQIDIAFRVYGGGHDWDVWTRGLAEGLRYLFQPLESASYRQRTETTR